MPEAGLEESKGIELLQRQPVDHNTVSEPIQRDPRGKVKNSNL
jgi:hypothetical protein